MHIKAKLVLQVSAVMSTNQAQGLMDIEPFIKEWAMKTYKTTRTKWFRKVKDTDLELKVDWSDVKFVHGEPSYEKKNSSPCDKVKILYKAQYNNRTNAVQEYSLNATTTSKSSCTVELTKGVTTGVDV